jgi:hypothetical protein
MVLGHEAVGVVVDCGPGVKSVRPGDHVIPVSIPECGICPACRSSKTNLCEEFFKPQRRRSITWRGNRLPLFVRNWNIFSICSHPRNPDDTDSSRCPHGPALLHGLCRHDRPRVGLVHCSSRNW